MALNFFLSHKGLFKVISRIQSTRGYLIYIKHTAKYNDYTWSITWNVLCSDLLRVWFLCLVSCPGQIGSVHSRSLSKGMHMDFWVHLKFSDGQKFSDILAAREFQWLWEFQCFNLIGGFETLLQGFRIYSRKHNSHAVWSHCQNMDSNQWSNQ